MAKKLTKKSASPLAGEDGAKRQERGIQSQPKLAFAKTLRKHQTDAEQFIWQHVRAKRMQGMKFKRQQPLGKYIVDFICFEASLIIEVDGGQHLENKNYDQKREAYLINHGYTLLRFWNHEVLEQFESVHAVISNSLNEKMKRTFFNTQPSANKKNLSGSVLISVLMITVVLSLVLSTLLKSAILQTRLTQSHQNQVLAFNAAESVLSILEKKIQTGQIPCVQKNFIFQIPFKMPKEACSFEFQHGSARYFTEDLGAWACLRIPQQQSTVAAHIIRLTVQASSPDGKIKTTLQSTMALPAAEPLICEKAAQTIAPGPLAWIEL